MADFEQGLGGVVDPGPDSLMGLEARLARDLLVLGQPAGNWVAPRRHDGLGEVLDVAVIGAGMAGLTTGFALLRDGVRNIRLFDSSEAGREGPWVTFARMETLRSPKHLTGPALGAAECYVPGVVRGAVWGGGLGRVVADPTGAVDGVFAVVSPGVGDSGGEWGSDGGVGAFGWVVGGVVCRWAAGGGAAGCFGDGAGWVGGGGDAWGVCRVGWGCLRA